MCEFSYWNGVKRLDLPALPLSYGSPLVVSPTSPDTGSWPAVSFVLVPSPQIARVAAEVMLLTVSILFAPYHES